MMEELYRAYYDELLYWCIGMTHDRAAAEDLVQETFLKAMNHISTLHTMEHRQCRSWLYKVAKNLFVDQVRRAAFEQAAEELPEPAETPVDFDAYGNAELLLRLPPDERKLIILRYLEGYNSTELGKLFSMTPGAVRAKLLSARKHLRKEWEE